MPFTFIEKVFPFDVSFGMQFGPTQSVTKVRTESGREYRNVNWSSPLQRATVAVDGADAQRMAKFRRWFYVTALSGRGFRVRDPNDYQCPDLNGTGVMMNVSSDDDTAMQAWKQYDITDAFGTESGYRKITKLREGTFALYDVTSSGRTLKILHTHYELDESTGIAIISFTPAGDLEWEGEFYVPMRFDVDEVMIDTINRRMSDVTYLQQMHEVPLIELLIES